MALKLNDGTVLRNLEEQVQFLTDYYQANEGLVEWGIHIVGQVATASELPNEETYSGAFGDAYAVGVEAPYNFYIWTRTSASGQHGYWFPFGPISIVGPQGPAPAIFNDGEYIYYIDPKTNVRHNIIATADLRGESTQWYTVLQNLPNANAHNIGDMLLRVSDGMVYKCGKSADGTYQEWKPIVSIMGSPGIQGNTGPAPIISSNNSYITSTDPQTGFTTNVVSLESLKGETGATGDPGGFIKVSGILANVNQLPSPTQLRDLEVAYLVGAAQPYELYMQVGENYSTAQWVNMGALNAATYVSVNGNFQNTWNADTKLDKPAADAGGYMIVPTINHLGEQGTMKISYSPLQYSLVPYGAGGRITTNAPQSNLDCANKQYVDNTFVANPKPAANSVITVDGGGAGTVVAKGYASYMPFKDMFYVLADESQGDTITGTGYFLVNTPTRPYHAANKKYVDDLFSTAHGKTYYTVYAASVDWAADDEQTWSKPLFTFASSEDVVGGAITSATLASMLYNAGYKDSDTGAFVSNAQSNNYAISSPLMTIWSPNGTSLYGYAPTRPDDIPLSASSWNIRKCKH